MTIDRGLPFNIYNIIREYRPGGDGLAGAEALDDGGHGGHGVSELATKAELDQYKGENRTDIFTEVKIDDKTVVFAVELRQR